MDNNNCISLCKNAWHLSKHQAASLYKRSTLALLCRASTKAGRPQLFSQSLLATFPPINCTICCLRRLSRSRPPSQLSNRPFSLVGIINPVPAQPPPRCPFFQPVEHLWPSEWRTPCLIGTPRSTSTIGSTCRPKMSWGATNSGRFFFIG